MTYTHLSTRFYFMILCKFYYKRSCTFCWINNLYSVFIIVMPQKMKSARKTTYNPICAEDLNFIKLIFEEKGWNGAEICRQFPTKQRNPNTVNYIINKLLGNWSRAYRGIGTEPLIWTRCTRRWINSFQGAEKWGKWEEIPSKQFLDKFYSFMTFHIDCS